MFGKKTKKDICLTEMQEPVIRCSICNREQIAGIRNLQTGHFEEIMMIQNERDLREFQKNGS